MRPPPLNDFESIFHENAYLSVQFSFKLRETFSLLFKWKTAYVRLFFLDNWAK